VNLERGQKIAEAALYEGYMLYPYRASAVKNQRRWNFGVLCPQAYCEAQPGSERWEMQTQCLVLGGTCPRLTARVRFLQSIQRSIARLKEPLHTIDPDVQPEFELVDQLTAHGQSYLPWQEAVEREVCPSPVHLAALIRKQMWPFEFAATRDIEPLRDESGLVVGIILRERKAMSGSVEIESEPQTEGVVKVTVRIRNLTAAQFSPECVREEVLPYSFLSVHTILGIEDGQFVSLLDPPEVLKRSTEDCVNVGTWPVLVGEEGDRDVMLSSPIILYDYPQVAPESPGNLFDGTEIDEILSLRILTMTDEEKSEMRRSDERAREILERTETMPPEQFVKLHGALRGLRPANETAFEEAR
jgi:hypothetical protein